MYVYNLKLLQALNYLNNLIVFVRLLQLQVHLFSYFIFKFDVSYSSVSNPSTNQKAPVMTPKKVCLLKKCLFLNKENATNVTVDVAIEVLLLLLLPLLQGEA